MIVSLPIMSMSPNRQDSAIISIFWHSLLTRSVSDIVQHQQIEQREASFWPFSGYFTYYWALPVSRHLESEVNATENFHSRFSDFFGHIWLKIEFLIFRVSPRLFSLVNVKVVPHLQQACNRNFPNPRDRHLNDSLYSWCKPLLCAVYLTAKLLENLLPRPPRHPHFTISSQHYQTVYLPLVLILRVTFETARDLDFSILVRFCNETYV
jgi:hypothetical protein